jgi:hypothetical protein
LVVEITSPWLPRKGWGGSTAIRNRTDRKKYGSRTVIAGMARYSFAGLPNLVPNSYPVSFKKLRCVYPWKLPSDPGRGWPRIWHVIFQLTYHRTVWRVVHCLLFCYRPLRFVADGTESILLNAPRSVRLGDFYGPFGQGDGDLIHVKSVHSGGFAFFPSDIPSHDTIIVLNPRRFVSWKRWAGFLSEYRERRDKQRAQCQ